ncbi:MAG: hypothetical protein L0Y66_11450 [Myxococcaceae bacterium]|nr:hypothetical protein [Myxococcaceae bacterium]
MPSAESAESSTTPPREGSAPQPSLSERDAPQDAPSKGVDPTPSASPADPQRERERRLWEQRLSRAQQTLDSYRASTRYPHGSRPIREHPDQVYPSSPEREQPLDKQDPASNVRLRLRQEHVFLAGDQTVDFWVRCEDPQGATVPCEVMSAVVHEVAYVEAARQLTVVPLNFADAGGPGDAQAGDGTLSARFQPSREGFALYEGTLRVELEVRSGPTHGRAFFDVIYTGPAPAAFTGAVRETVEHGSLVLRLAVQVRKPGRYQVDARADDARGNPFAHLIFNDELPAGRQEVALLVFGGLIMGEQPAFPLRLRDVEGFLLRERGDPDRELMLPLRGPVHTTRSYPLTQFSDAEWESEERQRYLDEFGKDVQRARDELGRLAGEP